MIPLLLALTAHGLELDEARLLAKEKASAVELARAETDAAEAAARADAGALLPQVTGFADVTVGSGYTAIGFERPVPWQAGVGARGTWTLIDPGRWAAAAAARRTARGQAALLAWARVQARRDATSAYASVHGSTAVADALVGAAEDAARSAEAVADLVRAGVRPPADAARARADAQDLRARAEAARGEVDVACAQLQALLDHTVDGRCTVDAVAFESHEPAAGPADHPALVAFDQAVRASRARGTAAAWAHLPTVSADGTAAFYAVPERTGPGWSATVSVDVPLTAPTTGVGDVAEARATTARAEADLDRQVRDLAVATVQARARLRAARRVLEARQAGVEAATEAWRRVDARFAQGLVDLTTWLDARRARIEADVALHRARAELGVALAEVEAAAGVE